MSLFEPRTELDIVALQRDSVDLDALATRSVDASATGVQALLAALTAEIDEGLDALLAAPLAVPEPVEADVEDEQVPRRSRRRTVRVVTAAVLAGGLVSVSGVAAAVTGDPFSPYRSLFSAVSGDEHDSLWNFEGDATGSEAALARRIRAVEVAIEAGHLGRAQAEVLRLRTDVGNRAYGQATAMAAQLAALERRLARARLEDDRTGNGRDAKADVARPGKDSGPDRGAPVEPGAEVGGEGGPEKPGKPDGVGKGTKGPKGGQDGGAPDKPAKAEAPGSAGKSGGGSRTTKTRPAPSADGTGTGTGDAEQPAPAPEAPGRAGGAKAAKG